MINSIFIQEVTVSEVRTTILSLKNSSPGWAEFPTFIAKRSIDNYIIPLTYLVNKCFSDGVFPSELKLAKVVPILKLVLQIKLLTIDQFQYYHFSPRFSRK